LAKFKIKRDKEKIVEMDAVNQKAPKYFFEQSKTLEHFGKGIKSFKEGMKKTSKHILDGFYTITGLCAFFVWLTIFFMAQDLFFLWLIPALVEIGIFVGFLILLVRFPQFYDVLGTGKGTVETRWIKSIILPNTINFFINIVILYFIKYGWMASSIWLICTIATIFLYGAIRKIYYKAIEELTVPQIKSWIVIGLIIILVISIVVLIVGLILWI